MIAALRPDTGHEESRFDPDQFLILVPAIRRQAKFAFQRRGAEAQEELVQEVTANAYRAWVRLMNNGRSEVVFPTPLAQFAIRQVRTGRRVGCRSNINDVLSLHACRIHRVKVSRLMQREAGTDVCYQLLVEDRHAGPAETAAARIDVAQWLNTLPRRYRQMDQALALGNTTGAVARQFGLSAGRVSQLRGWFRKQWERFQSGAHPDGNVL